LAINQREHDCHCVPAHTGIAAMMKVDEAITEALRNETLVNPKLEARHDLIIVRNRGHVAEEELAAFYTAGYGENKFWRYHLRFVSKVISNTQPYCKYGGWSFQKFAWKNNQKKTGHKLQSNYLGSLSALRSRFFCLAALHKKAPLSSGCGIVQIRILSA
jgi:hypothetical protein